MFGVDLFIPAGHDYILSSLSRLLSTSVIICEVLLLGTSEANNG